MLIVFIGLLLLVVGIIFSRMHKIKGDFWDDTYFCLSISCYFIAGIWLFVSMILILTNISTIDVNYENALAEKQMIEYRLQNEDDISGNELLYTQIVDFNKELRVTKKYSNSLWTNWFFNPKISTIDYIKIKD